MRKSSGSWIMRARRSRPAFNENKMYATQTKSEVNVTSVKN